LQYHPIFIAVTVFLLTACVAPEGNIVMADLESLPQDLNAYLPADGGDEPLLEPDRQRLAAERERRCYLAPWQPGWRRRPAEELFHPLARMEERSLFGGNRRPISAAQRDRLVERCDRDVFPLPEFDYPAVTLHAGDVRGLPTRRPAFLDFSRPGEGFPFDYWQYSAIPANTPVRVRHRSRDGNWLLVETAAMYGWLPAAQIAPVDENFMRRFVATPWLAVVRDQVALTGRSGQVLATASLGSLWPCAGGDRVWLAVRREDGRAGLCPVNMPSGSAALFPLALTPRNLATLGNRLLGQPYGWGGLFGDRDCSATLRDLYRPFGIWLPRNSAWQARAGRMMSLVELPVEERESAIRRLGVPWLTLVWMKGHIMLYVGAWQGRVALLHTLWGLKTRSWTGREGRYLIGRTIISDLRIGCELDGLARPDGELRFGVRGMTILGGDVAGEWREEGCFRCGEKTEECSRRDQ
jgi:hypothetical protein